MDRLTDTRASEFSGTLMGFDDYVSKLLSPPTDGPGWTRGEGPNADYEFVTDMVLEDVTELYGLLPPLSATDERGLYLTRNTATTPAITQNSPGYF